MKGRREVTAQRLPPRLKRNGVQVAAQAPDQGHVQRPFVRQLIDIHAFGRDEDSAWLEQVAVDFHLVRGQYQKEIGLAGRHHGAEDRRAKAHVAADGAAALAHAVNFTFFDHQAGLKDGVHEDVGSSEDTLATEAGDDDIGDHLVTCCRSIHRKFELQSGVGFSVRVFSSP